MELSEEECIDVYEQEQQRIKQLQENALTKQIQKLLQDKKELTSQLGNLSDQFETIKQEKNDLSDQLETIKQENEKKIQTLYDKSIILLQDNIIDETIYKPENGYTKEVNIYKELNIQIVEFNHGGILYRHELPNFCDSYIINVIEIYQTQNSADHRMEGYRGIILINNYGEKLVGNYYYNQRNIHVSEIISYNLKKFKEKSYILPDFIIKKIKEIKNITHLEVGKLEDYISMCKMNAENYYKQLYYKELIHQHSLKIKIILQDKK
jgi:DNA repair exonuclease SbcCD ATPase subunit